jgi:hypothetical protein
MIASSLLALSLICQSPNPRNAGAAEPRANVNDTVTILPSVAATYIPSLNRFAQLASQDPNSPDAPGPRIKALNDQGKLIQIDAPTRVVIQAIFKGVPSADPKAGPPTPIYQGRLLDGPSASRMAYFFATQIDGPAKTDRLPGPADVRDAEIYRAARAAKNMAKTKANQASLSIRKAVLARETDKALEGVRLKYNLTSDELNGIIRRGEDGDGTADRRALANNPSRHAAKAQNQAMLGAIDQQIAAGVRQTLIQAANTPPLRLGSPNPAPFGSPSSTPFFNPGYVAPSPYPYWAGRSVYVNGYFRANGTYVAPYWRSPPSR